VDEPGRDHAVADGEDPRTKPMESHGRVFECKCGDPFAVEKWNRVKIGGPGHPVRRVTRMVYGGRRDASGADDPTPHKLH